MKYKILIFFLLFFSVIGYSQNNKFETIQYDSVGGNLFPGYENAKLIVDFYYSEGFSTSDRYSYEIIIADSVLMLSLNSPETDDLNKISFEAKRKISKKQYDTLNYAINHSKLKQIKNGIPHPDYTAYTQKVLIIKSKQLSIAGGMYYSAVWNEGDTKSEIAKRTKDEINRNSSIGGNYNEVFDLLNNFFPEKDCLLKQLYK